MSQHPFNIINQTASATRLDLNNALGALASLSSGTGQPTTTFANMLWYETSTNWLWVRNENETDWIRFAYFNQITKQLALVDNTDVVNTSGSQTGLLGDQTNATWQAGTSTLNSLVSPNRIRLAVEALNPITTTSGSAPYYGCRAWGYVSTGNPVALDGSGNIASVVRNSTGKYTITFAVAMPNDNYAINMGPNSQDTTQFYAYGMTFALTAKSASSFQVQFRRSTNHDIFDCSNWSFSVVG